MSELALRFDNNNKDFMNWIGIISYDGEGLNLVYCYQDGYRCFSKLYTSCYLQTGGSSSAGGSSFTIMKLDSNGISTDIFTKAMYYGTFATSLYYTLCPEGEGLADDYDDISGKSEMNIKAYIAEDKVKISVSGWSEDSAVQKREKALVSEFENLGAQQIDEAEMENLTSLSAYESDEVEWIEVMPTAQTKAVISVDYAADELLSYPEKYTEFVTDSSENQVSIVLSTSAAVSDFCVLSLDINNVSDDGEITFNSKELYSLGSLTPDKPLVVKLCFVGDVPSTGLSYTDSGGEKQTYSISQSGNDGSLLLTKANLT